MSLGRNAKSGHSESSEMDIDGMSGLYLIVLSLLSITPFCSQCYFSTCFTTCLEFCQASDIAKLQRQFRIMEGDGQAYSTQAREQICKHQ